tara:strand:+ start:54 stop:311 length:258 start_codon:yes stop_codon:yes gene_type:complete
MLKFEMLEDQDWYKRRERMEELNLAVYVELESGSLEDVPIRMMATFMDGSEKRMLGRILSNENGLIKIQAINGSGDTLLCQTRIN